MKRITVFCGSSFGTEKVFEEQAFLLGQYLAKKGIGLVYGGAKVGLMGAVADGALSVGGEVTGVLPNFLKSKEIAHAELSELILVETMHERKMKMHELSSGIIALPGGFGTLEELFEMTTWAQLGLHQKPIGLLNVSGFYDPLLEMTQNMVAKGFLKDVNHKMLLVSAEIEDLIHQMEHYKAPEVPKWITREKT
ncbi:TIGR00730 family Rossman fold protein [Cesiribacter sp. SM1]|uniref:LOG family protein n=1 Tax=Cesiribacter sp. SM1 TaxID=2861196 RepID=UPI001CD2D359|nr:TIGR00730 family Rossman fold protein [Cesiribacter sp. SM1]